MKKKTVFKKPISLILAFLMIFGTMLFTSTGISAVEPTVGWGADAEDGIFYVNSASDMLAYAAGESANLRYAGKTVKLTADIDMSGVTWTPPIYFDGTFDGGGYTVKNCTSTLALIAYYPRKGAAIKNVNFENCKINSGAARSGGIAFRVLEGGCTFENINAEITFTTTATVAADSPGNNIGYGGFVGVVETDSPTSFINCSVTGSVTAPGMTGGFLGTAYGPVTFENCVSDAAVTSAGRRIGGFAGSIQAAASFTNCYSSAVVNGGSSARILGGIAGSVEAAASFTNCVSAAAVSGFQATGGIVGASRNLTSAKITMTDCAFIGSLTCGYNLGGLVARLSGPGTFTRCVSAGKMSKKDSGNGDANVSGALLYAQNTSLFIDPAGLETPSTFMTLELADCYAALDNANITNLIASHINTGLNMFNTTVSYTGETAPRYQNDRLITTGVAGKIDTLAVGADKTLSAETFAGLNLEGWVMTELTADYGTALSLPVIMPAPVAALLGIQALPAHTPVLFYGVQKSDNGDTYALRFVGTVDSLNYKKAGYIIKADFGDEIRNYTPETTQVYLEIYGEDGLVYTAEDFGGEYIFAAVIGNILKSYGEIEFSVKPYVVTADGAIIYGAEKIFKANAQSDS